MRARLALGALLLAGTLVSAAEPVRHVYVVTWASEVEASPERRALIEQFDRRLRSELRRRGATVLDRKGTQAAIVLRPSLEVLPQSIRLNLVGVRSADQKLLGNMSMKASGVNRDAQLRAIVTRACLEADQFDEPS